jgi:hypothetical protein
MTGPWQQPVVHVGMKKNWAITIGRLPLRQFFSITYQERQRDMAL